VTAPSGNQRSWAASLCRNWIAVFALVFGLYVSLPFAAPWLMQAGLSGPGQAIHALYSTQCHQLPDRSFFLFGPKDSYSLAEVRANWQDTTDPARLRQFVGTPEMGWKVAWSDRMVSMYTATLVFGLLWWPLRRRLPALPLWGLGLFLLPMGLDGVTHFLSDLAGGLTGGFRYDNAWLAALSGGRLPDSFTTGNALGSFNSWARLLSGVFFGLGVVGFGFPHIDQALQSLAQSLAAGGRMDQPAAAWEEKR